MSRKSLLPGMMIHQDGSNHEWVWDLIITMDDAINEIYSSFLWQRKKKGYRYEKMMTLYE